MELKLGHHGKDGIEVVGVEGEIDIYTAPRLRELLIDLVSQNNYQIVVNLEKVGFLDSTGLGVLVGGLKRVRAHDGSLDLIGSRARSAGRSRSPSRSTRAGAKDMLPLSRAPDRKTTSNTRH